MAEQLDNAIAIVGMSGRFPGARTIEEFWRNLREGVESIRALGDDELQHAGSAAGDRPPDWVPVVSSMDDVELFDAAFFGYNAREAEVMDPQHRVFLEHAWAALEDAGRDPEAFPGPVGVWAGASLNTYLLHHLLGEPGRLQALDPVEIDLGSAADFLATRVAYKLNLKGPSYTVQSACSTSLVAVHAACQSLLSEECDMALAGGVSISLHLRQGYRYQPEGILSPDGHCRAFDRRAAGTVIGSGVGVVVLRRLEDALRDGDSVRAVIRGSAVNNDGAEKVGFTAPSTVGQAEVIGEALSVAGVPAETIDYVEAHGTGTSLGDPVEVQALTRAFRGGTRRRGFCALGTVKSNVGHLSTAAGVASLIKTALCLEHRELPPSLHFEEPNPEIDFDGSPFFVNAELREWPSNGHPRRAGVSSFGLGGTNAHVVLEEAPAVEPSGPSRPSQVLLLSARSANALERATDRLAAHLEERPATPLADVAYTLRVGRKSFAHRRTLVCRDTTEAARWLAAREPGRVRTFAGDADERPVVFLFPGQGAQHVDMGRELYEGEPAFRQAIDEVAKLAEPHLGGDRSGEDLRRVLYPAEEERESAAAKLARTAFTQPALFAVELALARLWMAWGVRPRAMAGHSIGEYVAAVLAGSIDLADAVELVCARGRLIQDLPAGRMLSVPLPAAEASRLAVGEVSLAAVNAPELSVLSGPPEALAEVERRLVEEGTECRRLHTSHAFHSAMMEPILEPFRAAVEKVRWRPPEIPWVSNVTGTWIAPEEATRPQYWVRHLRSTVLFADCLTTLLAEPGRVLLEVGPGRTLSTLVRRQGAPARGRIALSTLPPPGRGEDLRSVLEALGRLWACGAKVDAEAFFAGENRRRIPLPTYPFEGRRYWVEAAPPGAPTRDVPAATGRGETPGAGGEEASSAHPRPELGTPFVEPRDAFEERLAAFWREALGVEVGVEDDFFELGGHSLLATRLIHRIQETFGVALSLRSLFDTPTVATLAAELRRLAPEWDGAGGSSAGTPVLVPDPEQRFEPFPLTDVQHAYWVGRSGVLELGGVATHAYLEIDVPDLDAARLEAALRRLVERHDMLRAIVRKDGRQQVLAEVEPYVVRTLDLSAASPETVAGELGQVRSEMSHQVLPADRWPLFEVRVSRLPEEVGRLHLSLDMLICDARSFQILLTDLARFYADPELEAAPLALTFRDVVQAELALEESEAFERARDYWLARLDRLPPAPELPLARDPASLRQPRFGRRSTGLDPAAWERLKERARRRGLTVPGVLLTAYAEVLARWSKNPRLTLNLTRFNRPPVHPQVDELVGDFTALTLLAVDFSEPGSFVERARQLGRQLWEDLDHGAMSGVRVLRELALRRGGGPGIAMPVIFTSVLDVGEGEQQGGFTLPGEVAYGISQTPQVWIDHQVLESDGGLELNWDVVEELFPEGLVDAMFGAYDELLGRLAGEDGAVWDEAVQHLLPEAQLEAREQVNATTVPVSGERLHDLFAARVPERRDHPAVITPHCLLTYGELQQRAGRLARDLLARLDRPEGEVPRMAVVMEKGWEQVVAVLAIHAAGAAYVPIEAGLPAERVHLLLEDTGATVALTQPWLEEALAWPEGVHRLIVEGEPGASPDDEPWPESQQRPDDLAYVIYTSGSTGRPKGVMIDHRGAVNTVLDINRRFGVGPEDRVLGLSSLSFDLSVYDVFGVLAAGGALVLPEISEARDPGHWARLVEEHGVTVWNTVPTSMGLLADHPSSRDRRLPLRLVMLSGDWIPVTLPERVHTFCDARLVSLGGATEASIWSIFYEIEEVDPGWASIPYGRPLANQSFQVLDGALEPRPVWVPGDLYIGGIGLARGYWGDAEKTAASFVTHPRTGERLYRTGDLGRYLPDGNIEFLGREDFQVKVRGYRIELGEIETALARHPGVRQAVVVAPETGVRERSLVAYVAPEDRPEEELPDAAGLREHLAERLPDYMVPADVVFLEALPLNATGKVDRQALPAPDRAGAETRAAWVAPRNAREAALADLWSEVLGVERVGIADDFFDLGGHSLTATRLIAAIHERFAVDLPLRSLFEAPTVARLSEVLERHRQAGNERGPVELPPLEPAPDRHHEPFALTDVQHAYWIGRSVPELGEIATHAYLEIESAELDLERLAVAFRRLIARHDMLRAVLQDDGRQQVLVEVPAYEIEVDDLSSATSEEAGERLAETRERMSHQVLPAGRWPLFEVRASRLPGGEVVRLHLSFDLLLADARSFQILLAELTRFYDDPDLELPPLTIAFRDFVRWQKALEKSQLAERSWAYWQERLETLPPAPELPLARDPASLGKPHFERLGGRLDPEAWTRLQARARQAGLTTPAVLLTAYAAVLAAWSKSPRFTLNLTRFNRPPVHPQLDEVVGDFTTVTLLAVEPVPGESFAGRARQLQEQLWDDLDHGLVSGVRVLRELARKRSGPSALMPVVFTSILNVGRDGEGGAFALPGELVWSVSQTPQVWLDHQVLERDGALEFSWDVVEDLFPEGLVRQMFEVYGRLLERLADTGGEAWDAPVGDLLPPAHLEARVRANACTAPVSDKLLHDLFAGRVEERHGEPAVITPRRTLTYGELYLRAGHLARALGGQLESVPPSSEVPRVAVVMEKGWEQVVAVLAVHAAGAAYVPIEAGLPAERVSLLLDDTGATVALTQPWLAESLTWPEGVRPLAVPGDLPGDASDEAAWRWPETPREPGDLAYVIYTSGSTGRPKGVMIDHRGAVNTVLDINRRFGVGAEDRVLGLSSLSFDLSVYDVFGILAAGGALVLPEASEAKDPEHWARLVDEHEVSVWNTVPTSMGLLADHLSEGRRLPLRLVMLSGDWIPVSLPERIRELCDARLVSLGGATEASIWSIFHPIDRVEAEWTSIPYGKPLANQSWHVLDGNLEPRPTWVPGDLYIAGIGLALGYWGDAEKTAASFITHPVSGERLYRTGDLGRYLPDGTIEFLGREDFQVKIRGFRVELGEIETVLARHETVHEAVVVARDEGDREKRLAGYVTGAPESEPEEEPLPTAELWDSLVAAGLEPPIPEHLGAERLAAEREKLDGLAVAYICSTLRALGAFTTAGEARSLDELTAELGVQVRYRRLMALWLETLVEDGYLEADGEIFRAAEPLPEFDFPALWRELEGDVSLVPQILQALRSGGESLVAVVRGEVHPLEVFFPEGRSDIAENVYAANRLNHEISAAILTSLVAAWPEERPLRVLEVGAGTGGLTSFLLPVLPAGRTVYAFTDLSAFFPERAREKYRDVSFMEYGVLDIVRDPRPQGFAYRGFDVVVASEVLHGVHDLDASLRHIRSLLAPGGLLLLEESSRWERIYNVSLLVEEQQAPDRWRSSTPFIAPEVWRRALAANGFEQSAVFPDAGHLSSHVLLARDEARSRPAERAFVDPGELRRHLLEHLPDYMVPADMVVLDALPLSATGKVDRKRLPEPERDAARAQREYVAPRNPEEEVVAGLWAELLGVEQVGREDDFFDLGGDSLLGVHLVGRLRGIFQVELPLRKLFEATTVAGLAQVLVAAESRPGQTRKIAELLRKIKSMPSSDLKSSLARERRRREERAADA